MKTSPPNVILQGVLVFILSSTSAVIGQGETLKTDLVAYYPFEKMEGSGPFSTPDIKNNQDLKSSELTIEALVDGRPGAGKAIEFKQKGIFFRTHAATDELPVLKHRSCTISFWAKCKGTGQSDRRLFSESLISSTIPDPGNPLFNLGTDVGNTTDALDVFIRQSGDGNNEEVTHLRSTETPESPHIWNDTWRHLVYVQTLQPDGTATRDIYFDGVLNPFTAGGPGLPPSVANKVYRFNTTSIGGIIRNSGISATSNSIIDDLAMWKRALTLAEIIDLRDNGVPSLAPPPLETLAVKEFFAEIRGVASGDAATLQWEVTKDITSVTISPAIGGITDLTSRTSGGFGNVRGPVNTDTTYTLTIRRAAEPAITATTSVILIPNTAAGWRWIEDFNDFTVSPLGSEGRWTGTQSQFRLAEASNAKGISPGAGLGINVRALESSSILEGNKGSLFFRFCYANDPITGSLETKVGITEKRIRFADDFAENIGTYIILRRDPDGPLQMLAINGRDATPVDSTLTFERGTVYNVWIEVTNNILAQDATSTDFFSVYVAAEGAATRRLVFDNFSSDRQPTNLALIGRPLPDINTVFLRTNTGAAAAPDVIFDDFYISPSPTDFPGTVPIPSSFVKVPVVPFNLVISRITLAPGAAPNTFKPSLTFPTRVGKIYTIEATTDLSSLVWPIEATQIPGTGEPVTQATTNDYPGGRHFFRIREQ